MHGNYLIPANTKRGMLILGLFRGIDLAIFLCGISATMLALVILPLDSTVVMVIAMAPATVCSVLVAPVPHYHNVLNMLVEMYLFFTTRQKLVWRGWCWLYGAQANKK